MRGRASFATKNKEVSVIFVTSAFEATGIDIVIALWISAEARLQLSRAWHGAN